MMVPMSGIHAPLKEGRSWNEMDMDFLRQTVLAPRRQDVSVFSAQQGSCAAPAWWASTLRSAAANARVWLALVPGLK
jgi:hypothetical protein